jgi:MSHA pilin protein MshC
LGGKSGREEDIIERRKKEPPGSFFYSGTAGFSIPELIAVLVIMGVLAAIAVPRLAGTSASFDEARLHDQTLAALRFAQKTAVTMQRTVCATFTGGTQLALTYSSAYSPPACDTNLVPPAGGTGPYAVVAQGSASFTGASSFTYDRVGRPNIAVAMVITVSAGRQIVVEPETGYVH